MVEVLAFTDGGCDPNPGNGGWGYLLIHKTGVAAAARGGEAGSTNNRMEYLAAINLLRRLKRPTAIEIRTDSQLLVNTMTRWVGGWKKNGWKRASGDIKNLDLVQELYELQQQHQVIWVWVAGHAGTPGNEFVDQLATKAVRKVKQGKDPTWKERFEKSPVTFQPPLGW